ncbi:MAG: glycosyltransferase [Pseudomonadota bacterium]|nr:glycosyltransferase [Pseudomonadota bacterium]
MRVIHLSDRIGALARQGGAEIACAHYLRQGQALGHEVHSLTLADTEGRYGFQLLEEIDRLAPDLVHVHNAFAMLDQGLAPELARRHRCLFSIYDVRLICPSQRKILADGEPCRQAMGRSCVAARCPAFSAWGLSDFTSIDGARVEAMLARLAPLRHAMLTAPGGYLRDELLRNGFLAEDVRILPPPVHAPPSPAPRRTLGVGRRLLFVGRVEADKGIFFLAEVLRHLQSVDWSLDLVGDADSRDEVEQHFHRLGLAGRARFHGFLPPAELPAFYDRADCLVIPSLVAESFSQVAAEALSRGLALVALAAGALGEWLRDGETALLIRRADPLAFAAAVDRVLADPELRGGLGERGWQYAREHFTADADGEVLADLYAAALARQADPIETTRPAPPVDAALPLVACPVWSRCLVLGETVANIVAGCGGLLAGLAARTATRVAIAPDADSPPEHAAWLAETLGTAVELWPRADLGVRLADLDPEAVLLPPGHAPPPGLKPGVAIHEYEELSPIQADQVVEMSDGIETKRRLLARFAYPAAAAALALDAYRGGLASGLAGRWGEALRRVSRERPTAPPHGRRLLLLSESPSAPGAEGKLLRRLFLPLQRRHRLDLVVMAPRVWLRDLDLPVRYIDGSRLGPDVDLLAGLDLAAAIDLSRRSPGDPRGVWLEQLRARRPELPILSCRLGEAVEFPTAAVDRDEYFPYSEGDRRAARADLLPAHVVEQDWTVFLGIGRNRERKQLPALLLSFARLLEHTPRAYLHLHTHPFSGHHDLVALARGLGLDARHLGFSLQALDRDDAPAGREDILADADLCDLYNAADVFVACGFGLDHGLAVLEAIACGLPVIAGDAPLARELLGDGRGSVVPRSDDPAAIHFDAAIPRRPLDGAALLAAMRQQAEMPRAPRRLGAQTRAWLKAHDWEQMISRWEVMLGAVPAGERP